MISTIEIIRSRKSKRERPYNGQKKKDKKTKEQTIKTGWVSGFCSTGGTRRVTFIAKHSQSILISERKKPICNIIDNTYFDYNYRTTVNQIWIGMYGDVTTFIFYWINDIQPTYFDWSPGEPGWFTSNKNCVQLDSTHNYKFEDHRCTGRFNYLCNGTLFLHLFVHNIFCRLVNKYILEKLWVTCFQMLFISWRYNLWTITCGRLLELNSKRSIIYSPLINC